MKILIINNQTLFIENLKIFLESLHIDYKVINFDKIKSENVDYFSHIILTGGPFKLDSSLFKEEIKIIKNYKKPVLGICFGFQLICKIFGARIFKLNHQRKGYSDIRIIQKEPIFKGISSPFEGYQANRYMVDIVNKELSIIAESIQGIEAVKHIYKDIYGFQFHPEMSEKNGVGLRLIKNFLKLPL